MFSSCRQKWCAIFQWFSQKNEMQLLLCSYMLVCTHSGDSKERKVENMQVNRFLSVTGHTHTHKRFLGLDAGTKKDFSTKVILICSILLFCPLLLHVQMLALTKTQLHSHHFRGHAFDLHWELTNWELTLIINMNFYLMGAWLSPKGWQILMKWLRKLIFFAVPRIYVAECHINTDTQKLSFYSI